MGTHESAELGVDSGQICIVGTDLDAGEHILTGIAGNGLVVNLGRLGNYAAHVRKVDEGDWGIRNAQLILTADGAAPEGLGLGYFGDVETHTGRVLVADPSYCFRDAKVGEDRFVLHVWGRDVGKLLEELPGLPEGTMSEDGQQVLRFNLKTRIEGAGICRRIPAWRREHERVVIEHVRNMAEVYWRACEATGGANGCGVFSTPHGQGVCASSGLGDGVYPCKTVDDGGWKRIEVTFITDGKEA